MERKRRCGRTIIESWIETEAQEACTFRICGPHAPNVSHHDTAAIWVAFFSRCQRYRCGQGKACNSSVMDSHQQPGSLFNGMILPLANLTIRSAIWYQGERLPLSA